MLYNNYASFAYMHVALHLPSFVYLDIFILYR